MFWVTIILIIWIASLYSKIYNLKRQIGKLHGSILLANWVTGFLDRLDYFSAGLDMHACEPIDERRQAERQLSNALYMLDNGAVRSSIAYLDAFINDDHAGDQANNDRPITIRPPAEWYREASGADLEGAYLVASRVYGDLSKKDVRRANDMLMDCDWNIDDRGDN